MINKSRSLGAVKDQDGYLVSLAAEESRDCSLLLYEPGQNTPCREIPFPDDGWTGNVCTMHLDGYEMEHYQYNFRIGNQVVTDPYAKRVSGRKQFGVLGEQQDEPVTKGGVVTEDYDWENDAPLQIPYHESILYSMHVRGFTMDPSARAQKKGTFAGIIEKAGHLTDLGVNGVILMPVNEFDEVIFSDSPYGYRKGDPYRLNYWGYTGGFYFAPKESYAYGPDPVREYKDLVKGLHRLGIEVLQEFYFPEQINPNLILDCILYWVTEYHIDGVLLNGSKTAVHMAAASPFLGGTKLLSLNGIPEADRGPAGGSGFKNLGEYNDGFLTDMRRFLKGDEDQVSQAVHRMKRNPKTHGVVNYITNHNGFTLMDLVSYDAKHNELNLENNRDGNDYNYSWNCGVEGPTRKRTVMQLRKKQMKNALLLLMLSQGTPALLGGDEFGNSQNGNNNAYCHDNEIAWIQWGRGKLAKEIQEFLKQVIAFRKEHPILHMPVGLQGMDYLSCGRPDLSYHGEKAWYPGFEIYQRQIGIMYCGEYAEQFYGKADQDIFVAVNMHWIPHGFALPKTGDHKEWKIVVDTSCQDGGIYAGGLEKTLADQKAITVGPRTIIVLTSC